MDNITIFNDYMISPSIGFSSDFEINENHIRCIKRYANECNISSSLLINRSQKHPSNLKLLGGSDYESYKCSSKENLSIGRKFPI